ncbi:MAG TPA: hypothetical protein PLB25_12645, partial [Rhodoferax sp.]|nr:hypothetical protein [Rhodoferax sp.]
MEYALAAIILDLSLGGGRCYWGLNPFAFWCCGFRPTNPRRLRFTRARPTADSRTEDVVRNNFPYLHRRIWAH